MSLLIGAFTVGLILSLLALGVFISFRIFAFPDITAEGSITLGAAVAATLLVNGTSPLLATLGGAAAGALAGTATGLIHTRFNVNGLLSGILVMTSLYSINLHVMGKSNVPLLSGENLTTEAEAAGRRILGADSVNLLGWDVGTRDLSVLIVSALAIAAVAALLYVFFRTNIGTAMRATGDNDQMIRALGVNHGNMIVFGLSVSNGLVALSGALLAQYQGFADVQMGIGMLVWGLASVIIGEALVGTRQLGFALTGAVMGSVLFRLLVAIALRWGVNPNDLKLITAIFVFAALILPGMIEKMKHQRVPGKGGQPAGACRVRDVWKTFNAGTPNEVRSLQGVNLDLDSGSFVIIIGTNGSGKSTLLNAVAGAWFVDAGKIELDGRDVTRWPEYKRAALLGRVFQNPFSGTAPNLSIAENVALAARRGMRRGLGWSRERKLMDQIRGAVSQLNMGLENRLDNAIGSLSGGQRQALTLMMATWVQPKLLLLDEHTAALDPKSADKVIRLSEEIISRDKLTSLMVTHSMHQAVHLGDRLIMMHRGKVIHDYRGAEKRRLSPEDLLARFEDLRRADQLDESAAEMLRRTYV